MAVSLASLFKKYESVDNHFGTDKNTSHSYGPLYEGLFEPRREAVRNVLEVGVFSGASAQVWTEYFPHAEVDGVDITLANIRFGRDNPRIRFFEKDGTTAETRDFFAHKRYDVIIDDGSHRPEHQIRTFELFAPLLAVGGVYVIEDIDERYANRVRESTFKAAEGYGLRAEWHDLRKNKNRWDDIVAVFYRD